MREEIKRINKLVAEGKLSPDDAADLIEAFVTGESARVSEPGPAQEAAGETSPPPPPPGANTAKDPFRSVLDSLEKLVKEGQDSVNWQEVQTQAKAAAKVAAEKLKTGIEDISKGKVHLGGTFFGNKATRELTLPLTLNGKALRVENACGDVKIVGGFDVGSVTARARFAGASVEDAKRKSEEYTFILEESDHVVVIKQPDVVGLSVDVEIQVPGTAGVEVRAENGDVEVYETKGSARVNARSGDVKVRGLNGTVEINAESGDVLVQDSTTPSLAIENKSGNITIQRATGNINARTAAGDVVVEGCHGKVVSVESVSGNVRVDIEEPVSGSLNIRTVSGHASVSIPDGSDCRVSLSTLRGSVNCGLDLEDEASTEQRVTGRLGGGSGTLDVSAVTGSISLELHDASVMA